MGNHTLSKIPNKVTKKNKKRQRYRRCFVKQKQSVKTKERSGGSRDQIRASEDKQATSLQGLKRLTLNGRQRGFVPEVVVVTSGKSEMSER